MSNNKPVSEGIIRDVRNLVTGRTAKLKKRMRERSATLEKGKARDMRDYVGHAKVSAANYRKADEEDKKAQTAPKKFWLFGGSARDMKRHQDRAEKHSAIAAEHDKEAKSAKTRFASKAWRQSEIDQGGLKAVKLWGSKALRKEELDTVLELVEARLHEMRLKDAVRGVKSRVPGTREEKMRTMSKNWREDDKAHGGKNPKLPFQYRRIASKG